MSEICSESDRLSYAMWAAKLYSEGKIFSLDDSTIKAICAEFIGLATYSIAAEEQSVMKRKRKKFHNKSL